MTQRSVLGLDPGLLAVPQHLQNRLSREAGGGGPLSHTPSPRRTTAACRPLGEGTASRPWIRSRRCIGWTYLCWPPIPVIFIAEGPVLDEEREATLKERPVGDGDEHGGVGFVGELPVEYNESVAEVGLR